MCNEIKLARYTIKFNEQASKIFDQCVAFLKGIENTEERNRLTGTLQHCFDILNRLGNAQLMYDFAPLSFTFRAGGLYGGLIFHGPTDGSGPNYSVELSGIHGWSLHT